MLFATFFVCQKLCVYIREGEADMFDARLTVPKAPLYRPEFEHDNCGIGACVNIRGVKSRETVENALKIVENL